MYSFGKEKTQEPKPTSSLLHFKQESITSRAESSRRISVIGSPLYHGKHLQARGEITEQVVLVAVLALLGCRAASGAGRPAGAGRPLAAPPGPGSPGRKVPRAAARVPCPANVLYH